MKKDFNVKIKNFIGYALLAVCGISGLISFGCVGALVVDLFLGLGPVFMASVLSVGGIALGTSVVSGMAAIVHSSLIDFTFSGGVEQESKLTNALEKESPLEKEKIESNFYEKNMNLEVGKPTTSFDDIEPIQEKVYIQDEKISNGRQKKLGTYNLNSKH